MARITDPSLRNMSIYSIFIRNHSSNGNFQGVISDLDRIAALGVDVIWLLPIHPIGKKNRKGSLGSPYAISDYRALNPEFGTMSDFKALLDEAHQRNLKVVIDIVFNHTSPDSVLFQLHPEWFWRDSEGEIGNRVGDWTDIIDLNYGVPNLWDYQIETLKGWLREGVDGFRCDVASLLPLSFWIEARDACGTVNPETLWIAETVEEDFITAIRRKGYSCLTDNEALRVFDLSYDYDVYPKWKELISESGNINLNDFKNRLRTQEATLGETDYKLRFLENHDQDRCASLLERDINLEQWTSFALFTKGASLIYAGQEYAAKHKPSLFDIDTIDWSIADTPAGQTHCQRLKQLIIVKKDGIVRDGFYWIPAAPDGILIAAYERRSPEGRLTGLRLGIFRLATSSVSELKLRPTWPELVGQQTFHEIIRDNDVTVRDGSLKLHHHTSILDWGLTL